MEVKKLINKVFFKKYQIKSVLGEGSFGNVYLVKNILTNKLYAAKLEDKIKSFGYLKNEALLLFTLTGLGIPKIITFGYSGKYNIFIEQLLGKDLNKLFRSSKNKIKDLCMTAIQILDRLKYIHSKDIIHRDIKPTNFLIGNPDSSTIYIIDFGLSRKYRSSRTGKHMKFSKCKAIPCTMLFSSINASNSIEQTRRDDLESLAYTLVYLVNGKLPWNGIIAKTKYECLLKAKKVKENTSSEKLCEGLPKELAIFTEYVKSLKFDENPNYDFLKNLFIKTLKNINEENDYNFSWVRPNEKIDLKALGFYQSIQSIRSIRSKPSMAKSRTRLLKNLERCFSEKYNVKKDQTFFPLLANTERLNCKNSLNDDKNLININTMNNQNNSKAEMHPNYRLDKDYVLFTNKNTDNEIKNKKIFLIRSKEKQNIDENKKYKKLIPQPIKNSINLKIRANYENQIKLKNKNISNYTLNNNIINNDSQKNFYDFSYDINDLNNNIDKYIPFSKRFQINILDSNCKKNLNLRKNTNNSLIDVQPAIKFKNQIFQLQNNRIINNKPY